jgi:hypothetical protein
MAETITAKNAHFAQQNETANREAREADRIEPRASVVCYDPQKGLIIIELRSGFAFGMPPERVPGLEQATVEQLSAARISPSGDGLHWDDLDVDVSLTGMISEALNLRELAPRYMGQATSPAKARAARLNGLKGGRPRQAAKRAGKTKPS